jgi:hypothetical protein
MRRARLRARNRDLTEQVQLGHRAAQPPGPSYTPFQEVQMTGHFTSYKIRTNQ